MWLFARWLGNLNAHTPTDPTLTGISKRMANGCPIHLSTDLAPPVVIIYGAITGKRMFKLSSDGSVLTGPVTGNVSAVSSPDGDDDGASASVTMTITWDDGYVSRMIASAYQTPPPRARRTRRRLLRAT